MRKPGESRAFSLPAIRRAPGACSAASCELAFPPRPPRWPAVGAAALPCFLHAAELRSAGLRSRANLPQRPASNAATGGLLDLVPPRGWFSALFSGAVHGLFHGPSLARGSLSLACPRESNQRRRKPRSRRRVLRASCAPGPRAGPGLRGGTLSAPRPAAQPKSGPGHPWPGRSAGRAALQRIPPLSASPVCHRADPQACAWGLLRSRPPRLMGPHQAAAIPGRRSASVRRSAESSNMDPVRRAGRMPALFRGPRTARRAADGSVAGQRPAIAAMDRGDRSDGPGMAHRGGPTAAREPGGQDARRARRWGVLSLAYFSLDKQREVGRGPGMPRGKSQGRRLKRARRTNLAASTPTRTARNAPVEARHGGRLGGGAPPALRYAASKEKWGSGQGWTVEKAMDGA
jgi:hypothetical protein